MKIYEFVLIAVIIIVSAEYFKMRNLLNIISKVLSNNPMERNKFEVVMQPKWFLYSIYFIILSWIYFIIIIANYREWWIFLFLVGFFLTIAILSKIIYPSRRQITQYFYGITLKRLEHKQKYTVEELHYLQLSNEVLKKALEKLK